MRNLTEVEKAELHSHCIFCKQSGEFWEGPHGGASVNIYCGACCAGFNVSHTLMTWQLIAYPTFEGREAAQERLRGILKGRIKTPAFFHELTARLDNPFR